MWGSRLSFKGEFEMAHHGYGSRALVFFSALLLSALVTSPARGDADHAVKQGTQNFGEWVDAVKTDHGKESRRYRLDYEWDTGLMHESVYTLDGKLVSERRYRGAPSPSPEEIAEADAIVRADPEIAGIMRRQPDLSLQGGFPIVQAEGEGPCTERTRCLQMLIFDGDNVVRHMFVDLRTGSILERDYIPPRNRAAAR
jgi:hypothetical protein